jgi:hypothetical protein
MEIEQKMESLLLRVKRNNMKNPGLTIFKKLSNLIPRNPKSKIKNRKSNPPPNTWGFLKIKSTKKLVSA